MIRTSLVTVLLISALLAASSTHAEIIGGKANLTCGFDFSAQRCTSNPDSMDVSLGYELCWFPCTCHKQPYAYMTTIPDKTLGEVCAPTETPPWCCGGTMEDCPGYWDVFLTYTRDGYWVKFAFTQTCWPSPECCEILYFIQVDGTSNLCPVPVEENTWGEIKAFYE